MHTIDIIHQFIAHMKLHPMQAFTRDHFSVYLMDHILCKYVPFTERQILWDALLEYLRNNEDDDCYPMHLNNGIGIAYIPAEERAICPF